jgi:hypothetical protein
VALRTIVRPAAQAAENWAARALANTLRRVPARSALLVWKFEDGPEDGDEEGEPRDVGPAWLDTFGDDPTGLFTQRR